MHDTSDDDIVLKLKNDISAALYTYLTGLHTQLEINSNAAIANDIVLSVLSLNIGHILGQLDPDSRRENLELVNGIIVDQITEVNKLSSIQTYGIIGHG